MNHANLNPVIYGEVLFDEFPDGSAILGGAPFNVAWHLQGFGFGPILISKVGADERGEEILSQMRDWNMTTAGVKIDQTHQTGRVTIALQQGQPRFEILNDVAYDFIETDSLEQLPGNDQPRLLYHGSLASRAPVSSQTLRRLRRQADTIFVDINLRAPWWNKPQLDELFHGVTWVKLNDDELATMTGCEADDTQQLQTAAQSLLRNYNWHGVIVTRGARGAFLTTAGEHITIPPVAVQNLVDTVGAGDGFSAVCLAGILQGWPYEVMLQRAAEFAARICGQRGAINKDTEFYRSYRQLWKL